jgi:tRNA 2-thiouridine synthesizing protein A
VWGEVLEVVQRAMTETHPTLETDEHPPASELSSAMTETHLNLRGLKCPLPALKTRKALRGLAAGDVLVVECTDPLATIDIPNLARETGDALETQTEDGGVRTFRIRKAASAER